MNYLFGYGSTAYREHPCKTLSPCLFGSMTAKRLKRVEVWSEAMLAEWKLIAPRPVYNGRYPVLDVPKELAAFPFLKR